MREFMKQKSPMGTVRLSMAEARALTVRALPWIALLIVVIVMAGAGDAMAQTNPFATLKDKGSEILDQVILIGRLALGGAAVAITFLAMAGKFPKGYAVGAVGACIGLGLSPTFISWIMSWGGGVTASSILGS